MIEQISCTVQIAKKDYPDDGFDEIQNWMDGCAFEGKVSFADLRILVKFKKEHPYKIKKGTLYVRQFNKYEGETYVFRMAKIYYDIAKKYNLFQYD